MQTLKDLLDNKRVEYDFSFYTLPINAEVAVTVLSEGKPLLGDSLDVIVPLQPTTAISTLDSIAFTFDHLQQHEPALWALVAA